jgi:acyl-CoA reductase-like NAD-dependent aldehyde dehydrogenase
MNEYSSSSDQPGRIGVRKTYKLFIGGAYPRSESGRVYDVHSADGGFLANAALASRKDARDAVVAARKAFGSWSRATAYNRGQILYRVAELLEGRRNQFVEEVAAAEGVSASIAAVVGSSNPVAGPFFDFSLPEPTGVVAIVAPRQSSLLGLVSVLAPVIAVGNVAVVLASTLRPLPAVTLTEVLATSDLPAGVVNLLTGNVAEVAPWLASHADVNAIDLTGASLDQWASLERAAADNLKRVLRPAVGVETGAEPDWSADPGIHRLTAFLETKTVWHPIGV